MDFVASGAQAYDQGPISPESWKRAVYRSAPQQFYVGVLPPEKQGGSYNFGLRISPIKDDNASVSTRSTSSKGSLLEYDIWRKWEDCLWFQDTLEADYALMAREKRTRLAAGKGVKKDGMYIQSDQAASFESLPPGPDPHSVARDIHNYIPKLTKKGTLFRASQSTIDQRHKEFSAMINAFFQDDLPMLLKELMATRNFTDFFGFWRRDHDRAIKAQKNQVSSEKHPRRSVSSSMLSTYFSASTSTPVPSGIAPSSASAVGSLKQLPRRGSGTSDSLSSENSLKDYPTSRPRANGRPAALIISSSSRSSNSTTPSLSSASISPSSASTDRSSGHRPMIVTHETPFTFGHNPQYTSDGYALDHPTTLAALPEDREMEIGKAVSTDYRQTRRRAISVAKGANQDTRTSITRPNPSDVSDYAELQSDRSSARSTRNARYSWQTTSSVSSSHAANYLAELDVDFTLPHPHPEQAHRPRASMCTMASYRTDTSADALVPRSSASSTLSRRLRHSMPFPDEEEWIEGEPPADESDYDDLLDVYFSDAIPPTPLSDLETPTVDGHFSAQEYSSYPSPAYMRRASITTSISSGSSDESAIAIKAMYGDSIIILRIPRSFSFTEVRQRLYDKFVRQEGVPLSETFVVALLVPAPQRPGVRPDTGSLWSIGAAAKDSSVLLFVKSNDDWDRAISKHGNKILLRIIASSA